MIGKTFAHYSILEKAGAGGMGVVFRARDETLHRDVALKLPSTTSPMDAEARSLVLREARAASALNHPHICTIYEVGEVEGQPYIAMEYIAGETLSRRIPPTGMPTESVLDFGAQIADALDHAHTHGILHRDLKSSNVRMTASGQVKVLDFGLAVNTKDDTTIDEATRSTSLDSGKVSGTLAYIAPELLLGKPTDARSDIWSLGVVLYELASGKLPFQGRTSFELTTVILRESPASLPTHVTPGLRAVITRCLAKAPENRYQRASEIRAALEALQSDTGATQRPAVEPAAKPSRTKFVLAAAFIAIVASAAFFYVRFGKSGSAIPVGNKLRLFLSTEGNLSAPALSPDGKMLAYVQETGNKQDLYVSHLSGGEHLRLTNDGGQKDDPQFSPDGEKIAFVRHDEKTHDPELCLISSLGGSIVPLMKWAEYPTWSSDGSRLAFIVRKPGEAEALATSSADGSNVGILLKGDDIYPFFGRASWSPDGKLIAASRSRGGMNREIWTLRPEGGAPARLTQDTQGVVNDSPVFTPDGRGIIHRSNRGGASNIWLQPLDAKAPVQLTSGPGPDSYPSVARNGTVAFLNSRSRTQLIVYPLPSGDSTTLVTESSRLWSPAFSPDGKEIVYSRDQPDGLWHLWIVATEGGQPRQITSGSSPEIYPRFSPDGGTIFFNTWGAEPLHLLRVSSQGGPARSALAGNESSDAFADISPDGKSLVFARTENKTSHIYISPVDGSAPPKRLLETPGSVARWSPDGNWISFGPGRSFSGGILVVHPDGSGLRQLTKTGGWGVWWPDGKQIAFQAVGADGNEQVRVYNLATGETQTLSGIHFLGTNYPFDVSPDGKRLAATNSQHISDEIWLLEPTEKK
jgi:eukaryotic-like serine/threonine-protein kinase